MAAPNLDDLLKEAPGFGECAGCKYLQGGYPGLCYHCASLRMQPLAPPSGRCDICDQMFNAGASACMNPVCAMSERWFRRNYAVAIRSGVLESAINAYKFQEQHGWSAIFGRILVGFLADHRDVFGGVDLIVASPTYTGPEARRSWDHIRGILEAAGTEDWFDAWPFDLIDPPAIIKTVDTPPMTGLTYKERRVNAEGPLRAALSVPDPARTNGKTIAVVDDVFTGGLTLREVARALRLQGGATVVIGLTLARQPAPTR